MAAATTRRARKTAPAKPKAVEEIAPEEDLDSELVEEETEEELVEDEADEDMEELEEDEVVEAAPKAKKKAGDDIVFGIQDLIALIKTKTGEVTDGRAIRTLIRKMAREDNPRVNREITPGNRTRYNWSGPNDPEVVAIVAAYQGGELEAEKQAKLTALKEQKAAKAAAKKAEEAEGDEEETPVKKATRKPAAKKAATPTRRTRKPAPVVEEVEDDEELDFDEE